MFAALLFAASFLHAQSTDFSGTWAIQSQEHIAGPQYSNAMAKAMKIQQGKDSLIIESVSLGGEGKDVTSRISFPMNGKNIIHTSATTKRKYERKLQWSPDKKSLTLTTVFYLPDNDKVVDLTRVEVWTKSADGQQLLVHKKSIETRSETWELKGVFGKPQSNTFQ